jgi:hypothetical protein
MILNLSKSWIVLQLLFVPLNYVQIFDQTIAFVGNHMGGVFLLLLQHRASLTHPMNTGS